MPAPCYTAWSGNTSALTSPLAFVSSAATVTPRTILQIAPASTTAIRPIEWGYLFSASEGAAPVTIELIDTGSIFASGLTAHTTTTVHRMNIPTGAVTTVQMGTALTGFTSGSAPTEGTITSTRLIAMRQENGIWAEKQYPLGREWEVAAGNCLRLRVTPSTAAAISIIGYISWEE